MSERHFTRTSALLCTLALATAASLSAQEAEKKQGHEQGHAGMEMASMMEAYEEAGTPGAPHRMLADKMAGAWDVTVKMWMGPGEPMTSTATSKNEMVMGGRFLRYDVEGDFMGQPFRGLGFTGYDNTTEKYEATWLDNHSTTLYTYTGSMKDGKLVMHGEHTDPVSGEVIEGRSVMEFVAPDRIVETAYEMRDGQEVKTMELTYTRQK